MKLASYVMANASHLRRLLLLRLLRDPHGTRSQARAHVVAASPDFPSGPWISTGRFFVSLTLTPSPMHHHDAVQELPRFIEQDHAAYTEENHDVWRVLYERRMTTLRETGS